MNNELTLKIIILGSSKVGKTSLLNQYFNKEFNNPVQTIGIDLRTKYFEFNQETVKINFIDTAGQERFDSISGNYLKNVNGVLLVYDISQQNTFKKIEFWNEQIKKHNNTYYSVVLIGNKIDLEDCREVKYEEGINKRKKIKCKFYETSAKNNINVTECFNKIAYLTYKNFLKNGFRSKSFYLKNNEKKEQKNNSKCC
jgi:small GTP-binding protein